MYPTTRISNNVCILKQIKLYITCSTGGPIIWDQWKMIDIVKTHITSTYHHDIISSPHHHYMYQIDNNYDQVWLNNSCPLWALAISSSLNLLNASSGNRPHRHHHCHHHHCHHHPPHHHHHPSTYSMPLQVSVLIAIIIIVIIILTIFTIIIIKPVTISSTKCHHSCSGQWQRL